MKTLRNRSQSMGLWLNETNLHSHAKLDASVQDLASSGYGIIRVMLRNSNFSHRSPVMIDAVTRIVAKAHALGVRVVLDCEPHPEPVARDMGNQFPNTIGVRIVRAEATVIDGRYVLQVPAPNSMGPQADFLGLEAAFLVLGERTQKLADLDFQHRVVREIYRDGFTSSTHTYAQGRPNAERMYVNITGNLPDPCSGKLVVYLRFLDPRLIDFWSEDTWTYFEQLLECYRGIPLDGVSWDEPATGGDWSGYIFGNGMAAAFERTNGYALRDKWFWMDAPDNSEESVRVRLDYYRTFNEGVFEAQRRLILKARSLFGENLILGTHHTWRGEGGIDDYRSGAVDYFRLNDQMDAGYTDCWWWDFKSVCYAYTLGSSLGRLSPSGETEVNTWDKKPTNSLVEFQARLMTLFDITWFNIWYGEASDCALYPADYTWDTTVREMNAHRQLQRRIGGAKPVIEVAMLHGWETVCGINRADIAAAHKAFCLNTAELFLERNVAFDWLDCRLLAQSRIENGRLINALGSYTQLILPYASVLSSEAWEKCVEFASAGGKVIFTGTPPSRDTSGQSLEAEFTGLMDDFGLSLTGYLARIDAVCTLPLFRPQRLDVCCELTGDNELLLRSIEGEAHGIQNRAGNVVYLSDLDPRERLLDLVERCLTPEVTCYSDSILWRLYREEGRDLLICVARKDRSLQGLIRWAGEEIEIKSGMTLLIECVDGNVSMYPDDTTLAALRPQLMPAESPIY